MLVLHGAWGVERTTGDAAFLLWAEDTALAVDRPDGREQPERAGARPHPYQASIGSLRGAIQRLASLTGRASQPVPTQRLPSAAIMLSMQMQRHG